MLASDHKEMRSHVGNKKVSVQAVQNERYGSTSLLLGGEYCLWTEQCFGTRPDIAQAVGAVSKFCSNPTEAHKTAVKRIFRY